MVIIIILVVMLYLVNYQYLYVQNQKNLLIKWIKLLMIYINYNIEIILLMIVFKLILYTDKYYI
jgi:hypothetical protein